MKPIYYFAPGVIEGGDRSHKSRLGARCRWMAAALLVALLAICAGVAQ